MLPAHARLRPLASLQRLMAAHPVPAFTAIAYAISYGAGVPWLLAVSAWIPVSHVVARTYLGRLLVVSGPALAGLALAAATGGRPAAGQLLRRFRPQRRCYRWYMLLPALTLAVSTLAYLLAGTPRTAIATALGRGWPALLAHYALQTLVIAGLEETGWRGWLLPFLLRRHRPLAAALIVGGIWGVWHLPILLSSPLAAVTFLVLVLALSILLTALSRATTGSLAVLALAHGSFNAPLSFLEPLAGPSVAAVAWRWIVAVYLAGAALGLALSWKWWLTPPPPSTPERRPA